MHWIDFHRRNDIETGLLEAETHPPGARKQIDAYWSQPIHRWRAFYQTERFRQFPVHALLFAQRP